jgi:RHS repeat-associated protein
MKPKQTLLIATLLALTSSPIWATNPLGETCSSGCKPCCEGENDGTGTGSTSDALEAKSLQWAIQVGIARYPKPTTFTHLAQAAYEKNGNLPDYNQLFGRYFSSSPLQQRQIHLELSQPQLSSATFHPSCLYLESEALFEIYEKPASNGFPKYIHQILTSDAFTLIEALPTPGSGWRLRVWKRDAAPLVKSEGYYVTSEFSAKTPLSDMVFKRPPDSNDNNSLLYIKKVTTGLSGTRTTTNKIVQTLDDSGKPLTVTSSVYAGEGTIGPILSQENLTYSERGPKVWDYTIVRETWTSSVDESGAIGSLSLTEKTREDYDDFSTTEIGGQLGMKRLVSTTEAYNVAGQSPQTTTYTYIHNPENPTTHGRTQSITRPDGSWNYSEYSISPSSPVAITTEYSGWKNLTMAQRIDARKTVTTTSANETLVETSVAGQLVSKSRTTIGVDSGDPVTTAEKWDGSAWHTTKTAYHPDSATESEAGRIKWIENSDGTATTYAYETVNNELVTTTRTGAGSRSGITAGVETKTTYGLGNFPIAQITKDIASGLTIERWDTDLSYNGGFDAIGRPIKRIYNADVADYDISQYACCGLELSRDRMGATTTYTRDAMKRVYKEQVKATPASPAVITFTAVNGLTTTRTRRRGSSDSIFLGSNTRSLDGLTHTSTGPALKSSAVADRPVTTTVITHSATGDIETTTYADASTAISTSFLDGRPKSISGTAVPDMTYDYATHAESGGGETSTTTASGVITTEFTDLLGRALKTVSTATGTTTYNYHPTDANVAQGSRGKLLSVTDGDNVTVTYGYNDEGERTTTSRTIPLAGGATATQVTTIAKDVISNITLHGVSLGVSLRNTQTVSSTGVAAITTNVSYTSIDGLMSGSSSFGSQTLNITTRPNTNGIVTRTTMQPDGTRRVETLSHGRTTRVENQDNSAARNIINATNYGYDQHQRLVSISESRTGPNGITTNSDFTESGDPLTSTQGATAPNIRITNITKDILGRTIQTTLPDNSVTYTSYWPTGQVKAQWGSQKNPVFHIYDEQNRLIELHTWQTDPAINQATATPPAGSAKTQWIYDTATGHLNRKQYPDSNGTNYTYTDAGKIKTRTWQRGITTTYGYNHGMLTTTNYSDGITPNVTITYDSLGRQQSSTNGLATSTFTYAADLRPDKETITYAIDGQSSFTRVIDHADRSLGRDTGWTLNQLDANGNLGATDNTVTYGYSSTTGRLETVANSTDTFTYTYLEKSNLLKTVTKGASGVNPALVTTRSYESTRDVLTSIQNKAGETTRSTYIYSVVNGGVNSIGQRKGVRTNFNLGGAHTANPGDTSWSYDNLGQLTSANHGSNDSIDRAYQYDAIGNRTFAEKGAPQIPTTPGLNTTGYTANALNQYNAITAYNTSGVAGTPIAPVFDADGNMEQGPLPVSPGTNCTLVWDAENRLIEVKSASNVTLVKYAYDALSRRISRNVSASPNSYTLYLYDGWNCIAEWNANSQSATLTTTRTWGLDLSSTPQGAGGVGGLLSEKQGNNTFYPTYDGNGNISEYLAADGSTAAHYEYDPFGNIVKESYASAYDTSSFSYKFSTKPLDQATGLYYYGYRYYDPQTGKWPSRDPIEEEGGVNLYGFVGNDGVNWWDLLGRKKPCCGKVEYNPNNQCCENEKVVQKVILYVFQGRLGGDGDKICNGGTMSHSYVSGNTNGIPSYGKHPRKFGQEGSPFKGPGYVNREDTSRPNGDPGRDPSKATKTRRLVCPAEKERMLKEGPTKTPYTFIENNCHDWAQGYTN